MRRIIVVCIFCVMALSGTALSHSPSKAEIAVTPDSIVITVTHVSNNFHSHYVNRIDVFVNSLKVLEKELDIQKENTFTVTIPIDELGIELKKGDRITAVAYCNVWGQRQAEKFINE